MKEKVNILWGEVKFLTGSIVCEGRALRLCGGCPRLGEIPGPTVRVRTRLECFVKRRAFVAILCRTVFSLLAYENVVLRETNGLTKTYEKRTSRGESGRFFALEVFAEKIF